MANDKEILRLLSDESTARQGFDQLVSKYGERLYWQVRRLVITHEDANDVVQNALIKAWTKLEDFQHKSSIYTWMSRIAVNEALDFLRRQHQAEQVDADDAVVANQLMASEYFDGDHTQALLQEAVSRLPEVQRTVFTLRYFEELKYSDISHILNTSEGALKASYHIATKKIEEFFNLHD